MLLAFALCFLLGGQAAGQITPSDDSYTDTTYPTINYGAKPTLGAISPSQTTYITFDLSSIPAGYTSASVAKASLKLYVNTVTTAGSFNVDYVNGTWAEKTITASNSPALGTTIAASVPLAKSQAHDYLIIDLTSAVGAWLNGSQTNDGIALVANSPFSATFDSKESTTQSHPPELDIVFTGGGGGGTITGVLTGAGSGLTGGGTSGALNLSLLTSCASGQVLSWSGSAWTCTSLSGGGTITGVTAGTDLTGGGTSGNVTLNLDITKVPQLNTANTFTGNQTVNGNLSATGWVTGVGFNIGSNLFAFGSYANNNAFLGFAGNAATTGSGNSATGALALLSNTTGGNNTANGFQALLFNTTGSLNTATGSSALDSNTTGGNNTASGAGALVSNTTGSYNTGAGYRTLYYNSTGYNNTALGYAAGPDQNSPGLTNATAVGANAVVSESNALVLGGTGSNAVKVGIGTATPAYTLDVNGNARYTGQITFASGQTFPGTGTITGVTAGTDLTGGGTSGNVTLRVDTTKVVTGVTAGTDLTGGGTGGVQTLNLDITKVPQLGTANTFTGNQTVNGNLSATGLVTGSAFNIGSNPFAFGSYSLQNAFLGFAGNTTTTGWGNTASGLQALYSNTTGSANTVSGDSALGYNTTGNDNTASGYWALVLNSTGQQNTAIGYEALYSNTIGNDNTASGSEALYANSTGNYNTASGAGALVSNTTGSYNTGAGYSALYYNSTGYNNTALGFAAGPDSNSSNLSYSTAIGASAVVSASNAMVLGAPGKVATGAGQVNVGIGAATPQQRLDVNYGDMIVRGLNNFSTTNDVANLYVGDTAHLVQAAWGKGTYIGTYGQPQALFVQDNTGNVTIKGSLSKGGGSFKIDHPLDPANKYLYHSFVESPDMMNIYNGNVVTDKRGLATIELPDWFEALNRDFRYQLTVMGQFAQAIVVQKVKNNHFTIKTNKPGVEVSWQVTGIRQDAYANAYRIPVEEEKKPEEQGHYLHPELFGTGPKKSVGARAPEPPRVAPQVAASAASEATSQPE